MTKLRTLIGVSVCLALVLWAATPPSGTVSEGNAVTWTGPFKNPTQSAVCNGPNDPACDNFLLTIVPPPPVFGSFAVEIVLQPAAAGDWDLQVYDSNGNVVGDSGEAPSVAEFVRLNNPAGGTYTVAAAAFAPNVGPDVDGDGTLDSYSARAEIKPGPLPPPPPGSEYFTYANYVPPEPLGRGAAEPSIGANWLSGRTMYQAGLESLRVTWDDCSSPPDVEWQDVSFTTTSGPSLDPILFTDPRTGRTLVSQLSANCSTAAFTDDDGANWLPSQGCGANSGVDHQSIGGGRYHDPIPTPPPPLYPHAVYYCAQALADATCSRSDDGGLTFGAAVPIYNLTECGGLHGEPNVAPNDGTVYVPNRGCTGLQAVVASEDNGLTWNVRRIPGTTPGNWDPDIGVGEDGTVYVGMDDGGHPTIAVSTDRGLTWSTPIDVGAPFDIDNTAFPAVVAGDGDRAAFAFLGIDADTGGGGGDDPSWPGGDPATRPAWHMYVAHTYDRGVTWTTVNVTPNDPVQRGTIFAGGFTVDPPLTRNLLDFNRATVDKFGRALIGWADGCVDSCITGTTNSNTEITTISRQVGGKRLFSQYDVLDVPAAPGNVSVKKSAGPPPANIINWSEPDDHGSRITEYKVYRRTPITAREVIASLGPNARSYTDSAIVAGETYFYSLTATNAQGESLFCGEFLPEGQTVVHPCIYPGVPMLTDATGDATGGQPEHDIKKLWVAEPKYLGPGKIMFILEMAGLANPTPDTYWPVQFNVGATTYTARMTTFPPATPASPGFEYYQGAWNTLLPTLNTADAASNFNVDGTIQIVVPRSGVGNPAIGSNLTSFLVRIAVNAGGVLLTPDNMPDNVAPTGSYTVFGSENCPDDPDDCVDPTFAGLQSVSAPPEVTCTLDLAWNTATTACPPPSYNIYRGTSSSFTPSLGNLIALGVDGLTYRDQAGLEFGTTYYYIVRAEDSQTSFDGPANHGREDNNLVYVSGTPGGPPASAPDFSDDLEPTSEPGYTMASTRNTGNWEVTLDPTAHSPATDPKNAWVSLDDQPGDPTLTPKDDRLTLPLLNLTSTSSMTFWHNYDFAHFLASDPATAYQSGGVIEISEDGTNWIDLEPYITTGGYNGTIDSGAMNPLAGQDAWVGSSDAVPDARSDAMTEVVVDLGAAISGEFSATETFGTGIRFRLGGTFQILIDGTRGVGWGVDDITVTGLQEPGPCDPETCGDGVVNGTEECDDGVFNSNTEPDACREDCTAHRCGDSVTDSGEGCDNGEAANSDTEPDACRTNCQPAHCGDDVLDSGELCDDGAANSNTEPDACRTNCLPARCGDGVVDGGEACDNGTANSDTAPDACRTYCQPARCGDGAVDTGEFCDNGESNSDTAPDACRTTCMLPSCGDSVTDTGEECDNGAANSDTTPDACRTTCALPACGDAVVDTGEVCDDGNTMDGDGCSAVCEPEVGELTPDPTGVDKNRFISFRVSPPATAQTGPATALRVTLVSLQRPDPPNAVCCPSQDFSAYESATCTEPGETNGCARWVGKPSVFLESQDIPGLGSFVGARLQCTPFYYDFAAHGLFHVTGAEIVPSSSYEVVNLGSSCMGNEDTCLAVSPPLTIATSRYGDIVAEFNPPKTTQQPDGSDVTQLVNKFKNVAGAPGKAIAQLQPNAPELNADVNGSDITQCVDAFKQLAYPFDGPCPCPSPAACGALACPSGDTVCRNSLLPGLGAGATCVKTCIGGANNGDPCINNTHCSGGGTCGNPFCRDRCGRCTP